MSYFILGYFLDLGLTCITETITIEVGFVDIDVDAFYLKN